ncbi:ACT domain-containing protein [Paraburkholderia diazotrophica]|uniref:ACT domain-containing protein n=1 Tax=Paraburkholderia diazotrophica TaxID=667676 RepID=UPI0038996073
MSDLGQLLASMHSELNEGIYVFASVSVETDVDVLMAVATFREKEDLTLFVEEEIAKRAAIRRRTP